ncbi:MAG: hypothetical protein ACUZ8A_06535 [Candidatus Bathyanammoxibius sp.]
MMRPSKGGDWESALTGYAKTPTGAMTSFVDRYFRDTADVTPVSSTVKRLLDAKLEGKREAAERAKQERLAVEEQNRLRSDRASALNRQFTGVRFTRSKVEIRSGDGNLLSTQTVPSIGGLGVTVMDPNARHRTWGITHLKSGMLVVDEFGSQASAKFAAWRLSQITDWTKSADEVTGAVRNFGSISRQLRNDPFVEIIVQPGKGRPEQVVVDNSQVEQSRRSGRRTTPKRKVASRKSRRSESGVTSLRSMRK